MPALTACFKFLNETNTDNSATFFRPWLRLTSRASGGHSSLNRKSKGKAVPLQAWSGPEGSRMLMFPDFMATAQDGGKVVSLTHWPLLP
jgi:hypothetical protein